MVVSEKRKREIEKEERKALENKKYREEIKKKLTEESKPTKDLLRKEWWSYSGLGISSGCLIPTLIILGLVTFPFGIFFWILGAIIWLGSRKKI